MPGLSRALSSLGLRGRLVVLVVASLVPLLGFSLVSQYLAYRDAVAHTAERVLLLARSMAFDVEQELDRHIATLRTLALSHALQDDDLADFRSLAERVVREQLPGAGIVVLEPGGQLLMSTGSPAGDPLPVRPDRDSLLRAVRTGQPAVSDLFAGRITGGPVIAIDVPVTRADGEVFRVLSINPAPGTFDQLVWRQALPDDWVVGVFDRRGTIVARLPGGERFIGQPASLALRGHLARQHAGVVENTTLDGVPVLSGFAHSSQFDWAVGIGVPRTEITGPAFEAALRTLLVGALLLALSVMLALAFGRSIIAPIARLRALATTPTREVGAPPPTGLHEVGALPPTGLREVDDVAAAFHAAERQRQVSEQSFRYLFECGPLPMWVYSPETMGLLAVNDAALATYGYARHEFLRMRVLDLLPPDERARGVELAQQTAVHRHTGDWHHMYRDGRVVDVEMYSHEMTFEGRTARIVVALDVTARKAAESQLVHAQKMEAVGELTGGLAHDFNNLLSVVIGNLGLLRDGGPDDPDFEVFLDEALAAGRRGADLTRSLLAFARRQPLRPVGVDANRLVSDLTTLLRRVLGEPIEIALSLDASVWPVVVDPNQLEAALVNLATNARDAMPKGGRLSLATHNRQLDAAYAAQHADVRPGDYVMIEVGDTGGGMSAEVQARIFEPFFTTKGRGQGTGLGLSMVFGFIKQSGGHIGVYSEPGRGTTFRLYLPRARAPGPIEATPARAAPVRGHGETILVVEDEPAMRRIVVRQLEQLGYRVLEADNAAAALRTLDAVGSVDLLFSDVVMAGKVDGYELSRAVAVRAPATRILLTSGFPAATAGGDAAAPASLRLLTKPYARHELARAIRDALDVPLGVLEPVDP